MKYWMVQDECTLSRKEALTVRITVSAIQASVGKTINDDYLQGIYKLSNRLVTVKITVQMNSTMCVLKRILI
jgi:hypothetical protein